MTCKISFSVVETALGHCWSQRQPQWAESERHLQLPPFRTEKKKIGSAIPCITIGLIETFIYVKSPTHAAEVTSRAKDQESASS